MTSAVDNLENLYLDYQKYPYKKGATEADKKERARRRNEISALESRIHKKLEEEKQQQGNQKLKNKINLFVDATQKVLTDQDRKNIIIELGLGN